MRADVAGELRDGVWQFASASVDASVFCRSLIHILWSSQNISLATYKCMNFTYSSAYTITHKKLRNFQFTELLTLTV